METILNAPPTGSDRLEAEHECFCASLGISMRKILFGITGKFWGLR